MCGIFGIANHSDAATQTYLGLYALQHRGQESTGISSSDGAQVYTHKSMGYVADVFSEDVLAKLKGTNAIGAPALWVPYMTYPQTTTGFFRELANPTSRRGLFFNVTGRLKPGIEIRQAEANLKTIARQLEQEYPNENKDRNVTLIPLAQATINPGFRDNVLPRLAAERSASGCSRAATAARS